MYDTVDFWLGRENILSGKPFDVLHYLSEITERQNEKGYSCTGHVSDYTGHVSDYTVNVSESGISLKGSLAKSFFNGDNINTLTRRATEQAIEQLNDWLHMDIRPAKVTRADVSTIILTARPPADYFPFLGNKHNFTRLQVTPDTLHYETGQRSLVCYDKSKQANVKNMQIPDILLKNNLFRYELRYLNHINSQLEPNVTAGLLSNEIFYQKIVKNWYNEFKTIQKLKNPSYMTDDIKTVKEAEDILFAHLLQQAGQTVIDEYLNELKAKNVFKDRARYSEIKKKLNDKLIAQKGEETDLTREIEKAIYNVAKYAR
jgi:hypothetical protein